MDLKDIKAQGQVAHMVQFIDQEAKERVEELNAKAEEEFILVKNQLFQKERVKIINDYEKKRKSVVSQKKILNSQTKKSFKLKVLEQQDKYMKKIHEEALLAIEQWTKKEHEYKLALLNLIVQGLAQMMEKSVRVRCRERDFGLVQSVLAAAIDSFKKLCKGNFTCEVNMDPKSFLAPTKHGVEIRAPKSKMSCLNTLETRLEMLLVRTAPDIRVALFGQNPRRKHLN